MTNDQRFVIVGAGQAGAWAARTLRENGYEGHLRLIGMERHLPYERPPLSKAILAGQANAESAGLLDSAAMAALDITFSPSLRIAQIDLTTKSLQTDTGECIPYDKLLLTTGGRAAVLPIEGVDLPGVHTLRTLDDAQQLQAALQPGKHVIIVGGGWIGLETAATARALGCEVTVLEFASQLCARSLPSDVARWLESAHRANGVDIKLSSQVTAFKKRDDACIDVGLSDGSCLVADAVVMGTGMIPNDELAQQAGLACSRGVIVDPACCSSDPHVHAAGDVAVFQTAHDSAPRRLESWQNAQDQGIAAGLSMLGKPVAYRPLPLMWSEQYQYMIQIAGHTSTSLAVLHRPLGNDAALYLSLDDHGRATSVVGINAGRHFRTAKKWVDQSAVINASVFCDASGSLSDSIVPSTTRAEASEDDRASTTMRETAN